MAWRGREEGIGGQPRCTIRLSLNYLEPTRETRGIEIRLHETVLYNSLYRFDNELLVNTHVMGSPAPKNPVIHVRRLEGGQLFNHSSTHSNAYGHPPLPRLSRKAKVLTKGREAQPVPTPRTRPRR